jgi:ACS family sodium-dependent inorganic phosphate cotransporter-like MFS transporter 5
MKWYPKTERPLALSIMEMGLMIGSIVALSMAGYLAEHGFAGGWPSTFYVSGIMALFNGLIWIPAVTSTPEGHFLVSEKEIATIKGQEDIGQDGQHQKPKKVPWKGILTNKAVWATVWSKFFLRWTFYTWVMKLPAYLNDVLHMSKTKNGLVNGSMYLAAIVPMLIVGPLSEYIISRNYLSRTNTRKLFAALACVGCATCSAIIPTLGCNQEGVIVTLIVGSFLQAFDGAGNIPNPGELSKHFSTTVFALVNMLNTSAGFTNPYLIGFILEAGKGKGDDPLKTWSIVFYLSAGVTFMGAVIFVLFGSGERQSFDKEVEERHNDKEGECSSSNVN